MSPKAHGQEVDPQGTESAERRPLPTAEEIKKLAPDGGDEFNRLVFEKSPYLLQHARNPVDWYPWGDAAFAKAKAEEKPIFLSIGYSTCHWCHVMEHESFEDQEVADLLNASFVCIKVDREERPDVDQAYMTVTQALSGSGGWPMTVVMTPDKLPFFAGTYFPKHTMHQRPGVMELAAELARAWKDDREKLVEHSDKIVAALRERYSRATSAPGSADAAPEVPGKVALDRAFLELSRRFDAREGGFGTAPKFPVTQNLRFLLRHARRSTDRQARNMVETTLDAMARGGIRDHVGGGFHRYSTDAGWLVPHFEKMLYDQALIALAYVEAYEFTRNPEYRAVAMSVFDYVLRDMRSPQGGFYSAEDADSEGEEGLFYLWNRASLNQVLGEQDGGFFADLYNIETAVGARGAGEHELGEAIPHLDEPWEALAARAKQSEPELRARVEGLRAKLFAARELRIHPLKDDKILTDWNGLMIAALSAGARAFDEPKLAEAARGAAEFVLANLVGADGRLLKRWRQGEARFPAVLDDYAYFVWGLLELYEADFDPRWLARAIDLEKAAHARFWDAEQGGYALSANDGEALFLRTKEIYDGALPSGNSVAALNLLRLGRITGDADYEKRAAALFAAFGKEINRTPSAYCQMLLAVDFDVGPSLEIVIAGTPGAADTQAMLRALRGRFIPNKVVLLRPDAEEEPAITRIAPYTKEQKSASGRATAYVCQNFACKAPTQDAAKFLAEISDAERAP